MYVVGKNDVVELREVKLGRLIDGCGSYTRASSPDETVVISGLQRVRAGGRVTPTRKQIADTSGAGAQR